MHDDGHELSREDDFQPLNLETLEAYAVAARARLAATRTAALLEVDAAIERASRDLEAQLAALRERLQATDEAREATKQ